MAEEKTFEEQLNNVTFKDLWPRWKPLSTQNPLVEIKDSPVDRVPVKNRQGVTVYDENGLPVLGPPSYFKAFVGAWGCGKTDPGMRYQILNCIRYPYNYILVGQAIYRELDDSIIDRFMALIPKEVFGRRIVTKWRRGKRELEFDGLGSKVIFRALDKWEGYKNMQLGGWMIDQAEELDKEVFDTLKGRTRHIPLPYSEDKYKNFSLTGLLLANPDGHNWIWDDFANHPKDNYTFLEGTTNDNIRNLTPEYISNLSDMTEEDKQKYLDGNYDIITKKTLPEWTPEVHFIEPFDIPSNWKRVRGIDMGIGAPTGCLWIALAPTGHRYAYDEYYEKDLSIKQNAPNIIAMSFNENYEFTAIDGPTARRRGYSTGVSYLQEWADNGIPCIPANNSIAMGINKIRENLLISNDILNPHTDKPGSPKLFVFRNCQKLAQEIDQLKWLSGRLKLKNEHLVSCLRYILLNLDGISTIPEIKDDTTVDATSRRAWDIIEKRRIVRDDGLLEVASSML